MKSKYPSYPDSNWDYSVKETARQKLQKPNKVVCLYCHNQSLTEETLIHKPDCPAKQSPITKESQNGNQNV